MSSTFNLADDRQWLWIVDGGAERVFRSDEGATRVMAFSIINLGPGDVEVWDTDVAGDKTVLRPNETWSKVAKTVKVQRSGDITAFGRAIAIDLRAVP